VPINFHFTPVPYPYTICRPAKSNALPLLYLDDPVNIRVLLPDAQALYLSHYRTRVLLSIKIQMIII